MIHTARISAIAILSKNRGLGFENHLLFHVPGELPRFKKITMGHPIIMGRKTFESIGKPLPGRTNIVITRDTNLNGDGVTVVSSLEEGIERAVIASEAKQSTSRHPEQSEGSQFIDRDSSPSVQNDNGPEIFVLGGGQIFTEALPLIDRLYLTIVDREVPADTFFPEYEKEFTQVIAKEEKTDWAYPYTFLTLER